VIPQPQRAVSSQPSTCGAVLGGTGVALLVAGLWRVDGALAALGLAAWCLLGLAWLLGNLNLRSLQVTLAGPAKVPAGVVFPVVLTLHNPRRLWDACAVHVELELPAKTCCGGHTAWLVAGTAADIELRVTLPRRACADIHPVRLKSAFPLGLFEHRRVLAVAHPLLVLPHPLVPGGLRALGVLLDAAPLDGACAGEVAGEPRGLRPWQPGDSPRRIVWPPSVRSWARGSGLVVREADPPGCHPRRCMVLVHSFGADGSLIRPERFELALSMAAGVLRHLHALGIPLRLIGDFDGWLEHPAATRAQLAVCHEVLARASRAPGTEAHDLQAAANRAALDETLVLISDMPHSAWLAALPKSNLPMLTPDLPSTWRKTSSDKRQ
jgi:uncharacterized protein (DUF58 family)